MIHGGLVQVCLLVGPTYVITGDIYVDVEVTDIRNSNTEKTFETNQRIRANHQVVRRLSVEAMVATGLV